MRLLSLSVVLAVLGLGRSQVEVLNENRISEPYQRALGDMYSTPVTSTPMYNTPVTSVPVYNPPVTSAPMYNTPVTSAPVYNTPVTSAPVYNTPVTSAPLYNPPVTAVPIYQSPVTTTTTTVSVQRCPVECSPQEKALLGYELKKLLSFTEEAIRTKHELWDVLQDAINVDRLASSYAQQCGGLGSSYYPNTVYGMDYGKEGSGSADYGSGNTGSSTGSSTGSKYGYKKGVGVGSSKYHYYPSPPSVSSPGPCELAAKYAAKLQALLYKIRILKQKLLEDILRGSAQAVIVERITEKCQVVVTAVPPVYYPPPVTSAPPPYSPPVTSAPQPYSPPVQAPAPYSAPTQATAPQNGKARVLNYGYTAPVPIVSSQSEIGQDLLDLKKCLMRIFKFLQEAEVLTKKALALVAGAKQAELRLALAQQRLATCLTGGITTLPGPLYDVNNMYNGYNYNMEYPATTTTTSSSSYYPPIVSSFPPCEAERLAVEQLSREVCVIEVALVKSIKMIVRVWAALDQLAQRCLGIPVSYYTTTTIPVSYTTTTTSSPMYSTPVTSAPMYNTPVTSAPMYNTPVSAPFPYRVLGEEAPEMD